MALKKRNRTADMVQREAEYGKEYERKGDGKRRFSLYDLSVLSFLCVYCMVSSFCVDGCG